jgi:hypothetical protein
MAKATPSITAWASVARDVSCDRPAKGAADVGVVVRRALAGEVGQEHDRAGR